MTNMRDFQLSQEQKAALDRIATSSGKNWDAVLDEAIRTYAASQADKLAWMRLQEAGFAKVWDNEHDDAYDNL